MKPPQRTPSGLSAFSAMSWMPKKARLRRCGRIDMALLSRFMPVEDYDYYLCGTIRLQSLYHGLRALNIADNRIHAEVIGPASLVQNR